MIKTSDNATRAVDAIVKDLCDRYGIEHEWHLINSETQDEIRAEWADIIRREYEK